MFKGTIADDIGFDPPGAATSFRVSSWLIRCATTRLDVPEAIGQGNSSEYRVAARFRKVSMAADLMATVMSASVLNSEIGGCNLLVNDRRKVPDAGTAASAASSDQT